MLVKHRMPCSTKAENFCDNTSKLFCFVMDRQIMKICVIIFRKHFFRMF